MHITLLFPRLTQIGGAERQILFLARELAKKHKVDLLTLDFNKNCYPELSNSLNIKVILPILTGNNPLVILLKFLFLNIYLLIHKTDILNCHNYSYLAVILNKLKNTPVIWMCNEPPRFVLTSNSFFSFLNKFVSILDKFIINTFIDKIIVLDNLNERRVLLKYGRNSQIVRTGIDLPEVSTYTSPQKKQNKNLRIYNLLYVGGLDEKKRPIDLIKTAQLLSKEYKLRVNIVGKGPQESELKTYVNNFNLNNIIFLGNVSETTLRELYASCDAVIYPAFIQSWGLTVIEGMAFKKPVIVSNTTGVAEIIQDKITGILVSPKNPREIADAVRSIILDKKYSNFLGRNAYIYVKGHLSWEKYAADMEKEFLNCLKR